MDTSHKLFKRLLMAGLGILVPIHISQAPEKSRISHVLCHLQVCSTVFPLRRTIIHSQFRPCNLTELIRHIIHFLLKRGLIGNFGHVIMMICMVSHRVSVLHHAFYDIRSRFQKMPNYKKSSRSVMFFQCIQNRRRIPVFIAAVKCQIQHLFVSLCHIVGIILFHLLYRGIAGGLLALCSKSQPPVFRFRADRPAAQHLIRRGIIIAINLCRRSAQKEHGAQKKRGRHISLQVKSFVMHHLVNKVSHIDRFHIPFSTFIQPPILNLPAAEQAAIYLYNICKEIFSDTLP